jgi:lipoprotein-anchoring transpeptidase ErfK/SrfK
MMNECEDEENLNGNPFGEDSETEETPAEDLSPAEGTAASLEMVEPPQHAVPVAVAAPVTATPVKNPFDSPAEARGASRSQEKASSNPFAMDDVEGAPDPAEYEYVSLVTPAVSSMRVKERDWEGEWEHVSAAVKKNFTSVSVVSPEVVSNMMMK